MDRTRERRAGNPLVGRAAIEAPLLSPVLALVPMVLVVPDPEGVRVLQGHPLVCGCW